MDYRKWDTMRNIAIITARGGSKRIPGKNKKDFCGKPIICYSIEAALKSGIFDEVMVSTDDDTIARIAKEAGASVPFMRSAATADDHTTTDEVLAEVLAEYKKLGKEFDTMVCLYPTAPFITAERLKEAYEKLKSSGAAQLMPVVPFSFPPQRGVISKDGRVSYREPQYRLTRSQDLEPIYHDCGQFYFYDVEKFVDPKIKQDDDMTYIVLDEMEVQDIDNETDWRLAELKYRLLNEIGGSCKA